MLRSLVVSCMLPSHHDAFLDQSLIVWMELLINNNATFSAADELYYFE